ncbi:hypothetical protein IEQ34_000218 [Dendrobium chrysotoxum]|uniref:Uncharacterized protein n=1 Tax=Dendrobium chrysotoxum TaxID=161865 RepID=A0AAV7HTB8_DENCH|nr:hypothetical protein IEQ34_000218 [Dendrobium chrysotoxum]
MQLDFIGPLERSVTASMMIFSLGVVEECGVDVRIELSLGLSSDKVECKKWERETNEIVVVKKPKMKEGPMHYYLLVMSTIFLGPKGYYYTYMMPWWVPISIEVVRNNLYKPCDNLSLALETDESLLFKTMLLNINMFQLCVLTGLRCGGTI